MTDWMESLRVHADLAAGRALAEQDVNPYSPTSGCFDRRYWAWKLVDFPEATFQRHVLPLAILYRDPRSRFHQQPEVLTAIRSGLAYASKIQHANGSFDQAFPFEQSYGATAFLLYPLLQATHLIDERLAPDERVQIHRTAQKAAEFLSEHTERHGVISNHLAGAALALATAADTFAAKRFDDAATALVESILRSQSSEGWFPEYDGADPGYQTLCVDYLTAYADRRPSDRINDALARAIGFLKWFVHPDGTFGGVYGSRRTSVVYLAGLARLATTIPAAGAMCETLAAAMARTDSVTPTAIDAGNLAPLLTSTVSALAHLQGGLGGGAALPCESAGRMDFPAAGLHIRSTAEHYVIVGVSNGGTVTAFSRTTRKLLLDDGGYVAELVDGSKVTTQSTRLGRPATAGAGPIELTTGFVRMSSRLPTPGGFAVLRVLNLTLMRSIAFGNWVKRRLVGMLMSGGGEVPLQLTRRVTIDDHGVRIDDRIENPNGLAVKWMTGGQPFSSIHMASAGYSQSGRLGTERTGTIVNVQRLVSDKAIDVTTHI